MGFPAGRQQRVALGAEHRQTQSEPPAERAGPRSRCDDELFGVQLTARREQSIAGAVARDVDDFGAFLEPYAETPGLVDECQHRRVRIAMRVLGKEQRAGHLPVNRRFPIAYLLGAPSFVRDPETFREFGPLAARGETPVVFVDREQSGAIEPEGFGRAARQLFPEIDAEPAEFDQRLRAAFERRLATVGKETQQPHGQRRIEPRPDVKRAFAVEQPAQRFEGLSGRGKRQGERGGQPTRVAERAAVPEAAAFEDPHVGAARARRRCRSHRRRRWLRRLCPASCPWAQDTLCRATRPNRFDAASAKPRDRGRGKS